MTDSQNVSRRLAVTGGLGAGVALFTGTAAARAAELRTSPGVFPGGLVTRRLQQPYGAMTGDVTSHSALLWSRASGEGRMQAILRAVGEDGRPLRGRGGYTRTLTAPLTGAPTDFTSKIQATGLPAGGRFEATILFRGDHGAASEPRTVTFTTPPAASRGDGRQTFVWTGDTAGQGWGINPDLGGMRAYAAMAATKPDFMIHSGDTIYADGPIQPSVVEPDGQVWRNIVTDGVESVAQSLDQFRGRHRYNLQDDSIQALYAATPLVAQWDDHETHNNWYPGQMLDDARYTERRVDVLAARAKQAWQEYQPISWGSGQRRPILTPTGYAPARIYRTVSRGPALDVFCLDMRTFKSPNTNGREPYETPILGEEQLQWLLTGLQNSTATWKVISNDLPLGLVVPDGAAQESISNADAGQPLGRELELARLLQGIKARGIKNVVFVTADVHYCAAHEYSPDRAAFTDFTPFWEFVAGPISAGGFGPNALDGTFGPRADFIKGPEYANQSPRTGKAMFFGHVEATRSAFTVQLIDGTGTVLYTKTLPAT
jgi:alkaline phosphatase D